MTTELEGHRRACAFDKGLHSPYFATDTEVGWKAILEEALTILLTDKGDRVLVQDLVPVPRGRLPAPGQSHLLIIAEEREEARWPPCGGTGLAVCSMWLPVKAPRLR